MTTNPEKAANNFENGYNCAQSVFMVYSEKFGIDTETALKLSSSFGGGMGRLREVCGAVSAMFMIAGLAKGYTENNNDDIKGKHYQLIQTLAQKFKEKHGTIICRELLRLDKDENSSFIPTKRTPQYYKERPCKEFIYDACTIIDKYIFEENM